MNSEGVIQTSYRGYRFRSRLEARWAVFLDNMETTWEYEKEGYVLPDGTRYLPDFWLPDLNLWLEIKGQRPTEADLRKCELLRDLTGAAVVIFDGLPGGYGTLFCWDVGDSSGGASEWEVSFASDGEGNLSLCICPYPSKCLFADEGFDIPIYLGRATVKVEFAADKARAARFERGEGPQ